MLPSRTRDTVPQAAFTLAIIATVVVLLTRIAHAAQAVAAPAPAFDWTGVALLVATVGSYVLHWLAARRHSATLERLAVAVDEGRAIVKPAGAGGAAMLAVLLLGPWSRPC